MTNHAANSLSPPSAAPASPCSPVCAAGAVAGRARALRVRSSRLRPFHIPQMIGVGAGPATMAPHAAIRQPGEGLLNRALDETELTSEAKETIRAAVRAAAQTPIR